MGRRGPTPQQPAGGRVPPKPKVPAVPEYLRDSAKARNWWRAIWRDPAARYWTEASRAAVVRLVELYVEHAELANEAKTAEPDVKLALLRAKRQLETPIAKLETELALTPFAKNRLGIPLVDPPSTEDNGDAGGAEEAVPPPPPMT